MKKLAFVMALLGALGLGWMYFGSNPSNTVAANQDMNNCIEKYDSKWGSRCRDCPVYKDSYKVLLRNTCEETVDLMCCVQKQYKNWECFYRYDMDSKDTLAAYACTGTGKYLKWTRKAGDKSIVFPTIEEVNKTYSK